MDINEPTEQPKIDPTESECESEYPTESEYKEIPRDYYPTNTYKGDSENKYPPKPERSDETQKAFDFLQATLEDEKFGIDWRISAARAILDHAHL